MRLRPRGYRSGAGPAGLGSRGASVAASTLCRASSGSRGEAPRGPAPVNLSDWLRGDTGLIHWLEDSERIYVPFIVLGEIQAGFRGGSQALKNEVLLARFLAKPGVHLLLPDAATADAYASLKTELRGAGTPIRANDLWIAALCLQHH